MGESDLYRKVGVPPIRTLAPAILIIDAVRGYDYGKGV